MLNYRQCIVMLICVVLDSSTSNHPGHLKAFGSLGPYEEIEEFTDGFPSPLTFFDKYVAKSRPLLFRQALANDSHLSMWNTDEILKKIFSNKDDIVHVETRKKESRKQNILSMTMTQFLERYQNEELYLVEEVPRLLR
jgi:hypothetical protein